MPEYEDSALRALFQDLVSGDLGASLVFVP